jgi:hypothetical protein
MGAAACLKSLPALEGGRFNRKRNLIFFIKVLLATKPTKSHENKNNISGFFVGFVAIFISCYSDSCDDAGMFHMRYRAFFSLPPTSNLKQPSTPLSALRFQPSASHLLFASFHIPPSPFRIPHSACPMRHICAKN